METSDNFFNMRIKISDIVPTVIKADMIPITSAVPAKTTAGSEIKTAATSIIPIEPYFIAFFRNHKYYNKIAFTFP